jgi:GT2 family glycosyltransferase
MVVPQGGCIDVIVPVHNQRPLVEACLESVLAARNNLPFELVVVDDASTDTELRAWLTALAEAGKLTLLTNAENLGFTKSVNRGMQLHTDRDVLLLNSDTVVHGDWLDRLHRAADARPMVASVNPLTNASHIGCYPFRKPDGDVAFEISDARLDALAAEAARGRYAMVPTTVGFCMLIRRAVLDAIGYFDAVHFPFGYGEETDFCYRAARLGWRHLVTGDVFVRHWEGQSFGKRKERLMAEMLGVFNRLHPDLAANDREFAERDPIRPLRETLDIARLKLLLAGATELPCVARDGSAQPSEPALLFDAEAGTAQLVAPAQRTLPNLPRFILPADMIAFNGLLVRLGITTLRMADRETAEKFRSALSGRPMDIGLTSLVTISHPPNIFNF